MFGLSTFFIVKKTLSFRDLHDWLKINNANRI